MTVALTAFACLDWLPPPLSATAQRTVVVRGASGGVGYWVVQLAKKLYNCYVIGICSEKNEDFVTDMGADEVVDYTNDYVVPALLSRRAGGRAPRKYDLFVDCVGGTDIFPDMHELLHPNAAYVTIVGDKTSRTALGGPTTYLTHPAQILRYIKGKIWGPRYGCIGLYFDSKYLQQVAGLIERAEAKVVVQEVIGGVLEEEAKWKKVVELMEEGRVRGKVVVEIAK